MFPVLPSNPLAVSSIDSASNLILPLGALIIISPFSASYQMGGIFLGCSSLSISSSIPPAILSPISPAITLPTSDIASTLGSLGG